MNRKQKRVSTHHEECEYVYETKIEKINPSLDFFKVNIRYIKITLRLRRHNKIVKISPDMLISSQYTKSQGKFRRDFA